MPSQFGRCGRRPRISLRLWYSRAQTLMCSQVDVGSVAPPAERGGGSGHRLLASALALPVPGPSSQCSCSCRNVVSVRARDAAPAGGG